MLHLDLTLIKFLRCQLSLLEQKSILVLMKFLKEILKVNLNCLKQLSFQRIFSNWSFHKQLMNSYLLLLFLSITLIDYNRKTWGITIVQRLKLLKNLHYPKLHKHLVLNIIWKNLEIVSMAMMNTNKILNKKKIN